MVFNFDLRMRNNTMVLGCTRDDVVTQKDKTYGCGTTRVPYIKLESKIKSTLYVTHDVSHGMKIQLMRVGHSKTIMVEEGDDDRKNTKNRERKMLKKEGIYFRRVVNQETLNIMIISKCLIDSINKVHV